MSLFSKTEEIEDGTQAPPDVPRKPLGALLVEAGLIDDGQLAEALHEGTQTGERLGELVVSRGWATEDDVARVLAEQWDLSYVDRASIWFDPDALGRMSREDAQNLEALPVRVEGDSVMVAVAEPTEQRLAELRKLIGDDTTVVVVPKSALDAGIRSELLESRGTTADAREESPSEDTWTEQQDLEPSLVQALPVADSLNGTTPLRAVPSSSGKHDPVELAARAREIADFISGHAVAIREYERRIEELETELTQCRATTAEAKTQLAAVLQLVDVLKPAV